MREDPELDKNSVNVNGPDDMLFFMSINVQIRASHPLFLVLISTPRRRLSQVSGPGALPCAAGKRREEGGSEKAGESSRIFHMWNCAQLKSRIQK